MRLEKFQRNVVILRKKVNFFFEFKNMYLETEKENCWEREVQKYLVAPRADYKSNILEWWKKNCKNYPDLSRMARDILSTTASSVFIERFFSSGSQIMTNRRNRMKADILNAYMCVHSWNKSIFKNEIVIARYRVYRKKYIFSYKKYILF